MTFIYKTFKINNEEYPIVLYLDNNNLVWFEIESILTILKDNDSNTAFESIRPKHRCYSFELIRDEVTFPDLPDGWHDDTMMINEYGFNQLILINFDNSLALPLKTWFYSEIKPLYPAIHKTNNTYEDLIDRSGYVYIATSNKYREEKIYKIGCTINPIESLCNIHRSSDANNLLYWVHLVQVENAAHTRKQIQMCFVDQHIKEDLFRFSMQNIQDIKKYLNLENKLYLPM